MSPKARAGRGHDFSQVLEWSAYKHILLEHYLKVWCYKLGSAWRELAFVDTCAGAGKYEDGKPGSPLIAARFNDDPGMASRGTGITVYAFETGKEFYPELVANLRPYATRTPPRAVCSNESFFDHPEPILKATRALPTLFFVDPFGTDEVAVDRLAPIVNDKGRASTELLVRIDPTLLARYAGWVRRQSRSQEPVRNAAGFERLLKRLNVDTEQIAEEAADPDNEPQDKYELLDQYLQFFSNRFRYVQVVRIRARFDAEPKYVMVHATNSPHGAAHFNDVVSKIEDGLFADAEDHKSGGQFSLLGPLPPPRPSPKQLDTATYTVNERLGTTEFIEVRAELVSVFGPSFRETDHKKSVKRLADAGRIQVGGQLKAKTPLRITPAP
jgi:three-Cys-motif partner protein